MTFHPWRALGVSLCHTASAPLQAAVTCGVGMGGDGGQCKQGHRGLRRTALSASPKTNPVLFINWFSGL